MRMLDGRFRYVARLLSLLLFAGPLNVTGSTLAATPDINPTLRIEAGGAHSAVIAGLAVSVDGAIIVTGSNDRTVRIWSMPGLRLVRTVFLPAWPYNNQGAAYTVALSPDRKTVVATGWTGSWESEDGSKGPWCFYVISVEKGDIQRTICDLPNWANHVAYSAKGDYLAFALKAGGGLQVYRTSDYSIVHSETYPETSTWVEFDGTGRIATTCYDGKIRLYDADFNMNVSAPMPEGRRPDSLSFSPNGSRIAVGYDEPEAQDPLWRGAIDIVSGIDLSVEPRPDLAGIDNGTLWRVAWSADGSYLYATGSWRVGNRYPIRRWADSGRGIPHDFQGSTSPNLRLRSLPSGGFVFTGEVPYLAVIGPEGRLDAERQIPIADYTDIGDGLAVSNDGLTVQFAFEPSGESVAYLSLARRVLVSGMVPAAVQMSHRILEMPGLDVRGWLRGYRPTLNGEPLKLVRKHEHALSLTFTPDGKSFLLGTGWNLIRYDSKGKLLWSTPVSFKTRGVVVTKDGRLVVAAIGDGTIRWYAVDTGKELLAALPHKDRRRWVAWTPGGYYMDSIDGDSLIGWTVNHGRESAAEFFEALHFRKILFQPNIVLHTLAAASETKAVQEANVGYTPQDDRTVKTFVGSNIVKRLPPVVRINSPADNSTITQDDIEVEYSIRSPSALPISNVSLLVEGKIVTSAPAKDVAQFGTGDEHRAKLKVKVPDLNEFSLSIVAEANDSGARLESQQDVVHLRRSGVLISTEEPKPTLYALIVGVGDYSIAKLKLTDDHVLGTSGPRASHESFPVRDAQKFAAQLKVQEGLAFNKVNERVLKDADANAIRNGLEWLHQQAQDASDIAVVYFSGHGRTDYLLPADFNGSEFVTGVSKSEVISALRQTNGRKLLFIDACQAAGGLFNLEDFVNDAKSYRNGIIVVVSSFADEPSGGDGQANSYFTTAVIEALKGNAARADSNEVRTSDLSSYLTWRVPTLSQNRQISDVYPPFGVRPLRLAVIKK
jgi:WD40 repeat protein